MSLNSLGGPLVVGLLLVLNLACANVGAEVAPPLKSGEGYLVLDLQLDRKVTAIELHRTKTSRRDVITLGPYEPGRYLELLPMQRGDYAIKAVLVPYYDLPFRLSFEKRAYRELTIQANRVNYFAHVWVGEERASDALDVEIVNRLAYSLPVLQDDYAAVLQRFPLAVGSHVPDHFFSEFLQTPNVLPQSANR